MGDLPDTRHLIKFIYTVNADGDVPLCEELVRGNARIRSTHSELNQGRNVYGAGELIFEKKKGRWKAVELNNGSGHYRPSRLTLPYAAYLIRKKIDLSECTQRDALSRGVATPEFTAMLTSK